MRLSDIKGQEAFKTIGKVIGCLKKLFNDEELQKIATEQPTGWILDFFEKSLEKQSDIWMEMFLVLNPDKTEKDISLGSVISFAYDFKNDPELMSLFFSQGGQMANSFSTPPMENTTETEKI
jgi:hypothetical protein